MREEAYIRKKLERDGWTLKRYTKHGSLWECGNKTILLPGSPGDRRSVKNFLSQLERAIEHDGTD